MIDNNSQTKFSALRMPVDGINTLLGQASFQGLIFQPTLSTSEGLHEFSLVYYLQRDNGADISSVYELEKITEGAFTPPQKIQFGNLPFSRTQLQSLLDGAPGATYLYFYPKQFNDFISYRIAAEGGESSPKGVTVMAFGDGSGDGDGFELKPSPPAR